MTDYNPKKLDFFGLVKVGKGGNKRSGSPWRGEPLRVLLHLANIPIHRLATND